MSVLAVKMLLADLLGDEIGQSLEEVESVDELVEGVYDPVGEWR